MKVEVVVGLGSPSLISLMVSVDVCGRKATLKQMANHSELRSCVKVEVAVLGSPSFWWVLWEAKNHKGRRWPTDDSCELAGHVKNL